MLKLRNKLPPLRSLIAFEACARLNSFTKAANELSVTQVAISRQIKGLEEYLGVKLFDRLNRSVRLSSEGLEFQSNIVPSLTNIAETVDRFQLGGSSNTLVVGTTTAFSAYWLMPRLSQFRALYPDVDLRFAVDDKCVDLAASGIHVAIRYGNGHWSGLDGKFLCKSYVTPLCSPGYWQDRPISDAAGELLNETLIDFDYVVDSTWKNWFDHFDVDLSGKRADVVTDAYTSMVLAVQNCQGIALLSSPLVEDFLTSGALIEPTTLQWQPLAGGYYIVTPKKSAPCAPLSLFTGWLEKEITKQTSRRGDQSGARLALTE